VPLNFCGNKFVFKRNNNKTQGSESHECLTVFTALWFWKNWMIIFCSSLCFNGRTMGISLNFTNGERSLSRENLNKGRPNDQAWHCVTAMFGFYILRRSPEIVRHSETTRFCAWSPQSSHLKIIFDAEQQYVNPSLSWKWTVHCYEIEKKLYCIILQYVI